MDCTSSIIMHIIEQFSLNLLCTCVKSSGTNTFFFTNEIFILIFVPGKKISKKVDAQRKLVDSDSEEELAAAQNMAVPPDDPGNVPRLSLSATFR